MGHLLNAKLLFCFSKNDVCIYLCFLKAFAIQMLKEKGNRLLLYKYDLVLPKSPFLLEKNPGRHRGRQWHPCDWLTFPAVYVMREVWARDSAVPWPCLSEGLLDREFPGYPEALKNRVVTSTEAAAFLSCSLAFLFLLSYLTLQIHTLLLARSLGKSHRSDSVVVPGWMWAQYAACIPWTTEIGQISG